MLLRYLGHSCFQITTMHKTLLADPFISGNPHAKGMSVELLHADYILITHAHGDHIGDALAIAQRTGAHVISNFEIVTWFEGKGVHGHSMNLGGKHTFDFGTLKYVSAIHSSTFPDNSPGGNPGGFVLWNSEGCLYIAGDTALTTDMQLIPLTCPKLSAAILPVGDSFTMGVEDALHAARFVQCTRIIGCHFDTFDAISIDHTTAKAAFAEDKRELILPVIGDEITLS